MTWVSLPAAQKKITFSEQWNCIFHCQENYKNTFKNMVSALINLPIKSHRVCSFNTDAASDVRPLRDWAGKWSRMRRRALKIWKNGRRNLEFYHEIKNRFSTYIKDFRPDSWSLKFAQLLSSSRLSFSRQSGFVFSNKSADINYTSLRRWLMGTKGIQFSLGFFGM